MILLQAEEIAVLAAGKRLVERVSFALPAGRAVTILGESGSGKSLLAQAVLGNLPPGLGACGRLRVGTDDFDPARPQANRMLWGRSIAVLPQEPWLALSPLMSGHQQVAEVHRLVADTPDPSGRAKVDLDELGLQGAGSKYPWELSGGMAQRVAFAAARAGGASVVIADEPTKGLDAHRRGDVLALLRRGLENAGGLLTITHDIELAEGLGGEILVMQGGTMIERGPAALVLSQPEHPYTRALIEADPERWPRRPSASTGSCVASADGLTVSRGGRQLFAPLQFSISRGQVLGVFGPSGCGKSTLGNALLGLLHHEGSLWRDPAIPKLGFQKLWQDPPAAFPSKITLEQGLDDLINLHKLDRGRIPPLLDRLKLTSDLIKRRPGEISGGELQRIALLRALLLDPVLLFADEPTSRLDPVTQAETIRLMADVVAERSMAMMIVSHDRKLLEAISDQVLELQALDSPSLTPSGYV